MQLYKKKKRKTKDKVVSKVGEVKLSLQSVGLWLLMMGCVCVCVCMWFFFVESDYQDHTASQVAGRKET